MNIDCFLYTNTGGRDHNEDAVGAREFPEGGLYVVADGLGGHMFGEQALAFVVKTLAEAELPAGEVDAGDGLAEQIEAANTGLLTLQEGTNSNMKSTVAALLLRGGEMPSGPMWAIPACTTSMTGNWPS